MHGREGERGSPPPRASHPCSQHHPGCGQSRPVGPCCLTSHQRYAVPCTRRPCRRRWRRCVASTVRRRPFCDMDAVGQPGGLISTRLQSMLTGARCIASDLFKNCRAHPWALSHRWASGLPDASTLRVRGLGAGRWWRGGRQFACVHARIPDLQSAWRLSRGLPNAQRGNGHMVSAT